METLLSEKIVKFYSGIISFIAIVVIAINLGIAVSSVFKSVIITDAEYIADRYSYKLENCETDECKNNIEKKASLQRKVELKKDLIDSISLLIVFSILFGFHYPKFRNKQK